eukprot:9094491-Pyramimonas_sp.AAC.1
MALASGQSPDVGGLDTASDSRCRQRFDRLRSWDQGRDPAEALTTSWDAREVSSAIRSIHVPSSSWFAAPRKPHCGL